MQQQKNQMCRNQNCQNQTYKNTKTGYCRDCYFKIKNQESKDRKQQESTENKEFIRICPNPDGNVNCKHQIVYKIESNFERAKLNNSVCQSCSSLKSSDKRNATKRLSGNWGIETKRKNNTLSPSISARENISKGLKKSHQENDYVVWNKGLNAKTDKRVAKTGKSRPAEMNPMFGSSYLKKWIEWFGEEKAMELNAIASKLKARPGAKNGMFGKTHSDEVKLLLRNLAIQKLQKYGLPFYNKQAIPIIEQYGLENGYNFRHAENHDHGEFFYIKCLYGYCTVNPFNRSTQTNNYTFDQP